MGKSSINGEFSTIFHVRLFNLGPTFWRRCGLKSFNYYKHRWLNLSPQHANWTLHVDDATTNWLAFWRKSPQDILMNLVKEPNRFHWWMIDHPKWCHSRWTPLNMQHLHQTSWVFQSFGVIKTSLIWVDLLQILLPPALSPRLFHVKRRNGGQRRNHFHQAWARAGAKRNSLFFLFLYLFN